MTPDFGSATSVVRFRGLGILKGPDPRVTLRALRSPGATILLLRDSLMQTSELSSCFG